MNVDPASRIPVANAAAAPIEVFVCYAHEDEAHRVALAKHLSALEDEGLIKLWHDRRVLSGREWPGEIDAAMARARVVLLLVSADFLASEFIRRVELPQALKRHASGAACVVPIVLRSCDWEPTALGRLQALPADGAPVVESAHPDQRFNAVTKGLRDLVRRLADAGAPAAPITAAPAARPARRRAVGWASALAVAVAVAAVGLALFEQQVAPRLAAARDALRVGHYGLATAELAQVPRWLPIKPGADAMARAADLGQRINQPPQDWLALALAVDAALREHPGEPALLVLQAQALMRRQEAAGPTRARLQQALAADPQHAEAEFLLGMVDDLGGATAAAAPHYRRAVELAPQVPGYRSNWAHTLLEGGQAEAALAEYRKISQFPLARLEQGLALWVLGRADEARQAHLQARAMLDDASVMALPANRLAWFFTLDDQGVLVATMAEKQCLLGLLLALPDDAAASCAQPPLRALVADWCGRYAKGVCKGAPAMHSEKRR